MSKNDLAVSSAATLRASPNLLSPTTMSRSILPEMLIDKHSTSYPWILHHILETDLSDELPLRIMFSFNAGHQLPTVKQAFQWWQYEPRGKMIIAFLSKAEADSTHIKGNSSYGKPPEPDEPSEVDRFMDANHQLLFNDDLDGDLSEISGRIEGLPVHFVRYICQTTFPREYKEIDFTQALTCLDYLRDLECTRRSILREAALRLGIGKENWRTILVEEPEAYKWVSAVQKQELAIEALYATVFVDLRIWTMVHELQVDPFYKPNVLAMLNTLFPPNMKEMPNDKIDIERLHKYRATFYQHILTVEMMGADIVKDFVGNLQDPRTKHSWPETRRALEGYMALADTMIKEAKAIDGIDSFYDADIFKHSRAGSYTCSVYSDRPATASSANTSYDGRPYSSSDSKSPRATIDSGKSRTIYTRRISNLSQTGNLFEDLSVSTALTADTLRSPIRVPKEGATSAATNSNTPARSPSTHQPNRISSKPPNLSVKVLPTTSPSREIYFPAQPIARPDNEVRALKRVESRRDSPSTEKMSKTAIQSSRARHPSSAPLPPLESFQDSFDFLSHPFEGYESATELPKALKRKKSFSDIFLRRKSSFSKEEHHSTHSPSSGDGEKAAPNRLRKLKSTSNLGKASPVGTWNAGADSTKPDRMASRREMSTSRHDEKEMPRTEVKRKKSYLTKPPPLVQTISSPLPIDPIVISSIFPRTPTPEPKPERRASRPKTSTILTTPKTPTHDVETNLETLGYALIDIDPINLPEDLRSSAMPLPLTIKKKGSRFDIASEEEKDRIRGELIEKRLQERSKSRENLREKALKEIMGHGKQNGLNRGNSENSGKKELRWQDGGVTGKASGWVAFEKPRKVPPMPSMPKKSVLRPTQY